MIVADSTDRDGCDSKKAPCRILVVEDEYIVALDICSELEALGVEVVGPAGTIDAAMTCVATTHALHGASLDVNVNGRYVFPVADILADRNVPFVFATGYDNALLPARYAGARQLEKPLNMAELAIALNAMCPDR